jgi:hypothetical protein
MIRRFFPPSPSGNTAIADAAAAAHSAAAALARSQAAAGKCIFPLSGGCPQPIFSDNLCFEHHHKQKSSSSGSSSTSATVSRPKKTIATPNKSTVVELVSSVRTQPKFATMLSYSITCLTKLAIDEVAVEEILECGTIEALEAALALHPDNERLHAQYMNCLEAFGLNGRMAKQIGTRMGMNFNKLGASLRNHSDVNTHIATAKAMAALAADDANMDAMADQGVLDALADAVKRNPDNAELLAAAAKVFSKFAGYKNEYADFITKSGATEVIIKGMVTHPENKELATNGAELLSILAGTGQANMEALKGMGAVDGLIAALEAHPYDKKIEQFATKALALLTGEDDMMRALNVCSGDMAHDLATAKALSKVSSLLLVSDNVDTMFRHKGVDWLIALLTQCEGLFDANGCRILEHGLRALMRSATDAHKIYEILKHGGVQLLVNLLNTHTDQAVLSAALGALAKLVSGSQDNANYIVANGGVNATLRAYALFPNEISIVAPVVDLLAQCSIYSGTAESLTEAGSIEALVDMLARHMDHVGLVVDIIGALGRLATSEGNVTRMADAGLLPLLVKALVRHMDHEQSTKTALLAIETAALLPSNIPKLLALGAVEAIHAAMARWPNSADIQAIGARALALLLRAKQDELERARLAALERARLEELERLRREREERERMEREMQAALARMKLKDEQDEAERVARAARERKKWEEDIRLKEMREKEAEAERMRLAALTFKPVELSAMPKPAHRSVRGLFDAEEEEGKPFELDPEVKQFLLSGQMLTKHGKTGLPAKRHVYLTQDLMHLIWNKAMTEIHSKNTMLVTSIYAVTPGQPTPQLQRVRFGQKLAGAEENCFSISGAHAETGNERSVDLECKNSHDRDKWLHAMEQLIRWVKAKKLYGGSTIMMSDKKKVVKKLVKESAQQQQQAAEKK